MLTLVRIETEVPLIIFDEPTLKDQVDRLLDDSEEKLKSRVDEIVKFLKAESVNELSYSNIRVLFKEYFCEFLLNEAVIVSLTKKGNYDILSNIVSLLTTEKLKAEIMGKTMKNAFTRAINSIPNTSAFTSARHGSMIYLLEHFI